MVPLSLAIHHHPLCASDPCPSSSEVVVPNPGTKAALPVGLEARGQPGPPCSLSGYPQPSGPGRVPWAQRICSRIPLGSAPSTSPCQRALILPQGPLLFIPRVTLASLGQQVTEEVHRLLRKCPYHFVCRGKVSVKGKGEMLTYFLEGRTDGNGGHGRPMHLERRVYSYGGAGGQARRPPLGPAPGPPVRAGLPPASPGPYPPATAAGREA